MWPCLTLLLTDSTGMTLNLWQPSCPDLPSAGIPGVCHHTVLPSDSECVCASGVRTLVSLLAQRQLEEEVDWVCDCSRLFWNINAERTYQCLSLLKHLSDGKGDLRGESLMLTEEMPELLELSLYR